MGVFDVDLRDVTHFRGRKWFKLRTDPDRPKDAVSGSIELVLKWIHNPELAFDPWEGRDAHPGKPRNELCIAVVRARNLPIMDRNLLSKGGSSDPVATVTLANAPEFSFKTDVRRKTVNPLFRAQFQCPYELDYDDAPPGVLKVVLEDWDELSGNDFMGSADVDLREVHDGYRVRKWYKLGGSSGDVELVLCWRHDPALVFDPFKEGDPDVPEKPPNELQVAVYRGKSLEIMDRSRFSKGGSSDPYAVVNVGPGEARTAVRPKTLEPKWKGVFAFEVEPGDDYG